jgi:hypothetical protein
MTGDVARDRRPRSNVAEPMAVWRPLAGGLLAVTALPLLIILPEAGLPIAFVALRLLAARFAWASRVDAGLRRTVAGIRSRFGALPWPWKTTIITGAAAALTASLWWALAAAT